MLDMDRSHGASRRMPLQMPLELWYETKLGLRLVFCGFLKGVNSLQGHTKNGNQCPERVNGQLGGSMSMDSRTAMSPEKDRQLAIKVAANCIDCTFQFASESLDSIGVPLAPRLAENIRPNLKGCEAEIAMLLKAKWNHVVFDWFSSCGQR